MDVHQKSQGAVRTPLVEVALDRGELPSQVARLVLLLEAVHEVLELGAVPLDAHALGRVEPVAGGLLPVLLQADEGALDVAHVVRADVAAPPVVYVQLAADDALVGCGVAHLPGFFKH